MQQLQTLATNYTLVLISFPIAILLAIVLMVIIRCLAECFIYLLVFVTVAALVAFGGYLFTQTATGGQLGGISLTEDPTSRTVLAVICFILALIITIAVCCFRKRLSLASKIV